MSRRVSSGCSVFLALALLAPLAHGCAEAVGDIDRTQPGLLSKAVFDGEWFMRRTVIDVPYDAGYTFIGEQEDAVRIRWEIEEKQLVAYRVTPLVEGTPDVAPVAAFAIEDHVDIKRTYNEATGEQANVIEENTSDRMWYERDYIRVDWSKNLLTNFNFYVDQLDLDPVAWQAENANDPDRLLLGVKQEDGTWKDVQDERELTKLREAQYIDVVTRVMVKPEELEFDDGYGGIVYEPACFYYLNYDCAPGVVSIRNAFLRVDAALTDHEPLDYPDNLVARDANGKPIRVRWNAKGDRERVETAVATGGEKPAGGAAPSGPSDPYAAIDTSVVRIPMFDKFGYFRVERYGYDPLYGEVEGERIYLATRWNIWEKTHEDDGSLIPFKDRKVRPIVYYLSPDFPDKYLPAAEKMVAQWNDAFVETVKTLGGPKDASTVFELRKNTREVDPDTGEVIRRGEVNGDLRYSHVYCVNEPTRAGLLGYGPSAADPYTGELFAADAYIYGATVTEVAAKGRDIIDLINGRLDPRDLALGENVTEYIAGLKEGGLAQAGVDKAELQEFAKSHKGAAPKTGAFGKSKVPGAEGAAAKKRGRAPSAHALAEGAPLPAGIEKLRRPAGWAGARLAHTKGTAIEDLLINDPALVSMKTMGMLDPQTPAATLPAGMRERISPVNWASPAHRKATLAHFRSFSQRNIMMASFFDDAVAGLALEMKNTPEDEVLTALEAAIFRSTAEHEVGHTLGLRHNFEGSTDALNYHDEYWDLRGESPEPLAAMTDKEKKGRLREYQYSSIMDYAGRFNTDISGLSHYDRAAIAFGYGQLVQVFDAAPKDPLLDAVEYDDGTVDRPFTLDRALRGFRHYTRIPKILGGLKGIRARHYVPYTREVAKLMGKAETEAYVAQLEGDAPWKLWEVPYRFCSDEYVFGTATCHAYDLGADTYEVVADTVDRYKNYYWFNNFKRDRIMFDEWDYMDTMYWRYFGFIQNAYQNWVFDQWFKADTWEWLRYDAEAYGIEDVPWDEATDGGLAGTAAARAGMRFLQDVIALPEPGSYMFDYAEGYAWSLGEDPLPLCTGEPSYFNEEWCSDVNITLGDGRYFYSLYDWESGYYFYERIRWIGTFYDKLLALETLTSPDTFFLGVDTFQSVDEWAISMNLAFPNEIQRMLGGIAADRFDLFAGVIGKGGKYLAPDPFKPTNPVPDWEDAPTGGAIDPQTSFTIQLYALWYGMAWLNSNYDNTFNDGAKIWLDGSGEGLTPADDTKLVTFADPFNNRTYVALRGEQSFGVGAMMLDQAQAYLDEWQYWLDDPDTDAGTLDYLKWRVTNIVENIEVVRGLYDLYGYLYF